MKKQSKYLILTSVIISLLTMLMLVGCVGSSHRKYVIGVSQCSEDSWRAKLQDELQRATYFNENVELHFASADDDNLVQRAQIDSLVNMGIDLLIVSPNQVNTLSTVIDNALSHDIPVILFDRKTDSFNHTAFMGADNYRIGEMIGEYVAGQLGGRGNIIEIGGLRESSPAIERHKGFCDAISRYPGMKVIGYANGDWKEDSGETAMYEILHGLQKTGEPIPHIDCVFGENDRMAVGGRHALEKWVSVHPECNSSLYEGAIFVGVDALPSKGGGMELVRDGVLTASAIYPTHGDELLEMAINILEGKKYNKTNVLQSSIVTSGNARVLLLQYEEVLRQSDYLRRMHERVDSILSELGTERFLLVIVLISIVIVCTLLTFYVRAYRAKHALYETLRLKNEELGREKEIAERQRDELEEQRDKIIEATMYVQGDSAATGQDVLDGDEQQYRHANEFMKKLNASIEAHLSDSALSVEDLGSDMCLSRVQLYRKVKAMTGKSPVELIRETRLLRAHQLLADSSLSISEIAYRVGFSSPSYFTKCYRDLYGKSPTEVQKR